MGFESSVSAHFFRVNFHFPRRYLCFSFAYLVLISSPRAKLHCLSLIWAGLPSSSPTSQVPGTAPTELWTGSWSQYFPVSAQDLLCVCLCGVLFPAVLWQRACSVKHVLSSLSSFWLKPRNHKYSPAGKQTRAEMKNPEAQGDVSLSQGIRMMFYVMKPNETSFQTLEEVPDYVKQVRLSWKRLFLLFLKKSNTSWGLVYFYSLNYEILIKLIPFHKDMEQK